MNRAYQMSSIGMFALNNPIKIDNRYHESILDAIFERQHPMFQDK